MAWTTPAGEGQGRLWMSSTFVVKILILNTIIPGSNSFLYWTVMSVTPYYHNKRWFRWLMEKRTISGWQEFIRTRLDS